MTGRLTTRILSEPEYAEWRRLVARSPDGSVYSLPEYLDVLCSTAGGTFRILAVERAGELLGGVGLYERRASAGAYVAPRLLLYYNGFVVARSTSTYPSERTSFHNEIIEALLRGLADLELGSIALRCRSPLSDVRMALASGWTAHPHYTYVVPLGDRAALWSRMEQNLRRLVERCRSGGILVTEDDDFASFYRLHAEIHERKGAALYLPRAPFQRYLDRLRAAGLARLYHARLPGGEAISTQLVLLGHSVTHTVCAASDAAHRKLGATSYLRWTVFERLADLNSSANDLTDAALNPVTHFKAQLGGDLELCFFLESTPSPAFRALQRGRSLARAIRRRSRQVVRRLGMARKDKPR